MAQKIGYLDETGKFVAGQKPDGVQVESGKIGYIDSSGKFVASAPVEEQIQPQEQLAQTQTQQSGGYTIQSGDTLSGIAVRQGITVDELLKLNPEITDPNKIFAGQSLVLPGAAPATQTLGADSGQAQPQVQPQGQQTTSGNWRGPDGNLYPDEEWARANKPELFTGEQAGGATPEITPEVTQEKWRGPDGNLYPSEKWARDNKPGLFVEDEKIIPEKKEEVIGEGKEGDEEIIDDQKEQQIQSEQEIRADLYEKYGIEDLEDKFKQKPEQTFEDIYSAAYQDSGLGDLKAEMDATRKEIAEVEEDRDERIAKINEDPWLSEASRVGRVKRETDKFEAKLTRLQNKLILADSQYSKGKEDAENVAMRAINTFVRERDWAREELEYYINRAELDVHAEMAAREVEREEFKWMYLASQQEESKGQLKQLSTGEWAWIYEDGRIGRTGVFGESKDDELTAYQKVSRADRVASQFDGEAIVKRYGIVAEGYSFAQALNTASETSANDQGLVYAFAKAMDPDSVVREGEYATVLKYSQSWAEKFGFDAQRIFSNTPFLTKEARDNMIGTIGIKYQSILPSYQNLYNSYTDRIDKALESSGIGQDYITDYSKAFSSLASGTGNINTDLEDDIRSGAAQYNYEWGREKFIEDLMPYYPELTKDQIAEMVYEITKELWGS